MLSILGGLPCLGGATLRAMEKGLPFSEMEMFCFLGGLPRLGCVTSEGALTLDKGDFGTEVLNTAEDFMGDVDFVLYSCWTSSLVMNLTFPLVTAFCLLE